MKTFNEYLEEKEMLEEGIILTFLLKLLGFGTMGLVGAYATSLIAKSGAKATRNMIDNFKDAYGTLSRKQIENIKKNVEEAKKDPVYKNQVEQEKKIAIRYSDELAGVYEQIDNGTKEEAKKEYDKLSQALKHNPEINRLIADRITEKHGTIIWTQTPGSKGFQWLRTVVGYQYAKYISGINKEKMEELMGE